MPADRNPLFPNTIKKNYLIVFTITHLSVQWCISSLHCNPWPLYSLLIAKANDLKSPVEKWNFIGCSWTWINIFNSNFYVLFTLLSWNHFFWLISVFSAGSSCIHTYLHCSLHSGCSDMWIQQLSHSSTLLLAGTSWIRTLLKLSLVHKSNIIPLYFLTVQLHSYQRAKNHVTWCRSCLGWKFYTNRLTGNIIH
jgi:hypothetical protein